MCWVYDVRWWVLFLLWWDDLLWVNLDLDFDLLDCVVMGIGEVKDFYFVGECCIFERFFWGFLGEGWNYILFFLVW